MLLRVCADAPGINANADSESKSLLFSIMTGSHDSRRRPPLRGKVVRRSKGRFDTPFGGSAFA